MSSKTRIKCLIFARTLTTKCGGVTISLTIGANAGGVEASAELNHGGHASSIGQLGSNYC